MSTPGTVVSYLSSVTIEDVRKEPVDTLDTHFSPLERKAIEGRAVPTVAGMLALKLALLDMAVQAGVGGGLRTSEIELDHDGDGRPLLRSFPSVGGTTYVSISHDRLNAWGLAVLQEVGKR